VGFSASTSGGSKGRFLGNSGGLSDINVTPFVDVVLVLLIIFMVTAPFAVSGVNIDLPRNDTSSLSPQKDPIVLSVTADEAFYLGDERVLPESLVETLKRRHDTDASQSQSIYIRADRKVPYGSVMRAMEAAKQAGFKKIGMMGKTSK
jgi:biopolymer transport protein TolR